MSGQLLFYTAEHDAVSDGEEDVFDPRVGGDGFVERIDDTGVAAASQLAVGLLAVLPFRQYPSIPQHIVEQQYSASLHFGE